MKTKNRTEISFETHEVTIIRFNLNQTVVRFCAACGANVRYLPVSRAAGVLRISERQVYRLIENGQIHSTETETGALLVCRNSLVKINF